MSFTVGHPEYRTEESIRRLKDSMRLYWANNWSDKKCPTCKCLFRTTKGRNKTYCSRICAVKSLEVRVKISENQKGKLMSKESKLKMSVSAKLKHKKGIGGGFKFGNKHWNWSGGISTLRHRIHNCSRYREWRKNGFKRDRYTCVLCGQVGSMLHFDHHPKSFNQIIKDNKIKTLKQAISCEKFWDLNNGRTLCIICHRKTDNYGNKIKKL